MDRESVGALLNLLQDAVVALNQIAHVLMKQQEDKELEKERKERPNGSEPYQRTIKQAPKTGKFSREQIARAVARVKNKRRVITMKTILYRATNGTIHTLNYDKYETDGRFLVAIRYNHMAIHREDRELRARIDKFQDPETAQYILSKIWRYLKIDLPCPGTECLDAIDYIRMYNNKRKGGKIE